MVFSLHIKWFYEGTAGRLAGRSQIFDSIDGLVDRPPVDCNHSLARFCGQVLLTLNDFNRYLYHCKLNYNKKS